MDTGDRDHALSYVMSPFQGWQSAVHDEVGTYLQGIALLGKGALGAIDAAVDKHRVVFGVGEVSAPYIQLDATEIHHCMSPEGGIELLTILIVNIPIGRAIA